MYNFIIRNILYNLPNNIVYFWTSTLPQSQNPSTWICFELEVPQVRHHYGIHNNRLTFGTQSDL